MTRFQIVFAALVLTGLAAHPADALTLNFEGSFFSNVIGGQPDTLGLVGNDYRITADVAPGASGTGIPLSNGEFEIIGGTSNGTYAVTGELGVGVLSGNGQVLFTFDATGLPASEGRLPHGRTFEMNYVYVPSAWGGGDDVADLVGIGLTSPTLAIGKADVAHASNYNIADQYNLTVTTATVAPEPASMAMFVLGVLGLLSARRRR